MGPLVDARAHLMPLRVEVLDISVVLVNVMLRENPFGPRT